LAESSSVRSSHWLAAVNAADPDLEVRARLSPLLNGHSHKLAHPGTIYGRKRIILPDPLEQIIVDKFHSVIPGDSVGGLSQVVGSEGEELGFFGDLIGRDGRPRDLDHRPDCVGELDFVLGQNLFSDALDDLFLICQFGRRTHQWNHDLGKHLVPLTGDLTGRLEDRLRLHFNDLRIGDVDAP
jgi:hypothetical protein